MKEKLIKQIELILKSSNRIMGLLKIYDDFEKRIIDNPPDFLEELEEDANGDEEMFFKKGYTFLRRVLGDDDFETIEFKQLEERIKDRKKEGMELGIEILESVKMHIENDIIDFSNPRNQRLNSNSSTQLNKIITLISDDELEKAFSELLKIDLSYSLEKKIIILKAKYSKFKKESTIGTVNKENSNMNFAQIISGLLELVSQIKQAKDDTKHLGFKTSNSHVTNQMKISGNTQITASSFFVPLPDVDEFINQAKVMDICGVTLAVFIEKGLGGLRKAIENGANVRILLIEDKYETQQFAAARSEFNEPEYYKKKLALTLNNLNLLLKLSNSNAASLGRLQVKTLSYPPSFGIEVFDTINNNPEDGIIKIEMYSHHSGWGEPPIFLLNKLNDSKWYSYFRNQFEEMWKRGGNYDWKKL